MPCPPMFDSAQLSLPTALVRGRLDRISDNQVCARRWVRGRLAPTRDAGCEGVSPTWCTVVSPARGTLGARASLPHK